MPDAPIPRPWSARRPQSLFLSIAIVIVAVALVITALRYIGEGIGGFVPYLMFVLGPTVAVYYIWYWNFYRFGQPSSAPSSSGRATEDY